MLRRLCPGPLRVCGAFVATEPAFARLNAKIWRAMVPPQVPCRAQRLPDTPV